MTTPSNLLTIRTYPGIGDFSWVYSKVVNLNRPLHIVYHAPPHAKRRGIWNRCEPFLDLLPAVHSYSHQQLNPRQLDGQVPPAKTIIDKHSDIICAANSHLEHGRRLETFMPDLPTSFHYDINVPPEAIAEADQKLGGREDYLLIYTSSLTNIKNYKAWLPAQWTAFINEYRKALGDIPVVLTGARYDTNTAAQIVAPDCLNLVGQTSMGATIELIRRSRYLVVFPSGIGVLATVLKKPVYFFYPKHLGKLMRAWPPQQALLDRSYLASYFIHPQRVVEQISYFFNHQSQLQETAVKTLQSKS